MSTPASSTKRRGGKGRSKVKKSPQPIPPPPTAQSEPEEIIETSPVSSSSQFTPHVTQSVEDQERLRQLLAASRGRNQSLWETVCNEIEREFFELDILLTKLGQPPYSYRKDKVFPELECSNDETPPPVDSSITRIFLDFYIFPQLLPAIESMIQYARKQRVFQCPVGLFNPLDYIVEYLYTNNPNHPGRKDKIVPLMDLPFVKTWLSKNPRPPYPKWLRMSFDEAAIIIQRCVLKWLARRKRRQLQAQLDLDRKAEELPESREPITCAGDTGSIFGPYYDEMTGEDGESGQVPVTTHSQHCPICNRFRQFVQEVTASATRSATT